jgi:hypothetical protein
MGKSGGGELGDEEHGLESEGQGMGSPHDPIPKHPARWGRYEINVTARAISSSYGATAALKVTSSWKVTPLPMSPKL